MGIGHQKAILESLIDMNEGKMTTTTKHEKQNTESLFIPLSGDQNETGTGTPIAEPETDKVRTHTFVVEDLDEENHKLTAKGSEDSDSADELLNNEMYTKGNEHVRLATKGVDEQEDEDEILNDKLYADPIYAKG